MNLGFASTADVETPVNTLQTYWGLSGGETPRVAIVGTWRPIWPNRSTYSGYEGRAAPSIVARG
jgi:hypothetical protein